MTLRDRFIPIARVAALLVTLLVAGRAGAQCTCSADLDGDEIVGFSDLTRVLTEWGICVVPCAADFDDSGDVGFNDLTFVLQYWGPCTEVDDDIDGIPNCLDQCPGQDDNLDTDGDLTPDCLDGCPDDPLKTDPGICGCDVADDDTDLDGVADCVDQCPGQDDNLDTDGDLTPDCLDGCPDDPLKTTPGVCGCGVPETPECGVDPVILSDDFNRCGLDTSIWTTVDPVGDATFELLGAGTDDAYLAITVPPNSDHDAWVPINLSARAMQPAANGDFQIEAKFDSPIDGAYQLQGLLIEEDADTFVRADFYSTNSATKFFVATVTDGSPNTIENTSVAGSLPMHIRVTRTGDDFVVEYGFDGVLWIQAAAFNYPLAVSAVGPFAGSTGSSMPGHTALVDYFFNTAAEPATEDGPIPPGSDTFTVAVDVQGGNGVVWLTPDLPFYDCGDTVTLTAMPDAGYSFTGWSGDISAFDNPVQIQVSSDRSATANFLDNSVRPIVTNIQVLPGTNTALITWDTDIAADSTVHYGLTSAYELGSVSSPILVTSHSVLLTGLDEETTHHYQIVSANEAGFETSTVDLTFNTLPPGVNPFAATSDDFNRFNIDDARWTLVDPIGDGQVFVTGVNTDQAALNISVPQGEHAFANGNETVRLMQDTNNTDFDVRIKFLSEPSLPIQEQGLLIEQDDDDFLQFNFYRNLNNLRVRSASHVAGTDNTVSNDTITAGSPLYLRVTRSGNDWEFLYGYDDTNWISVATLNRAMTINQIGVFAGNAGFSDPPFTAVIDYFEVMTDELVAEDAATNIVERHLTVRVPPRGGAELQRRRRRAARVVGHRRAHRRHGALRADHGLRARDPR